MATKSNSKSTAVATTKPAAKSTAVATRQSGVLALPEGMAEDIEADLGKGFANIDADSVAIPFLAVLQTNSPQVDPDSGDYIPDAKAGMLFNTVTKEVFDGKEGVQIVPCEYQRKFLRWSPREAGGGFKGEYSPEAVAAMRQKGQLVEQDNRLFVPDENGNVNPKKSDKVADTRVHYVLILNPNNGQAQQAVLSLSSTQIKKSKGLLALLGGVTIAHPTTGVAATPPMFANVVRISTVPESNDQGKWSGVKFDLEGFVKDSNTYRLARGFHQLIGKGNAEVNYDAAAKTGAAEGF